MIPFNQKITPINFYVGEWTFEVKNEKHERYEMIVFPEGGTFQLIFPNGQSIRDRMQHVYKHKGRINLYDQGLIAWIYEVFEWCEKAVDKQELPKEKTKIVIDGRKYVFSFCPQTEEISLTIPSVVAVLPRSRVSDTFEEIYQMEFGSISSAISDLMYEAFKDDPDAMPEETPICKVELPLLFHQPKTFLMSNNQYQIQYDKANDLILFVAETRVIKTFWAALDAVLPEINHMHGGELLKQIYRFVDKVKIKKKVDAD